MVKSPQRGRRARSKYEPGTVRVYSNGALRISRDLLGEFAGDRRLRFSISVKEALLMFKPSLLSAGWPVYYGGDAAKSPRLNLRRFFRNMCMKYPEPGVYHARCNQREIWVQLWPSQSVKKEE